ncbi:hypothetical protein [Botrimarina hoheduenensis]|uniref:Uncharacterized protein n=1 Tax=Botrimarina hoheduenensis TaxID=2528000 RepID=A0A5C5VS55_9BACT|nr:hypothetical protein [Botrimarina hoheduenensis]TWT41438.1 hypothetical protein Pla111_31530 [Botrimarina hoheduenensis]
MLKRFLQWLSDWTGDSDLDRAIHAQLRRDGYAVHAAQIREVRLAAIQRPGWVQVYRFAVETHTAPQNPHQKRPVVLLGLSREDGRESRIEVLLTEDEAVWRERLEIWSEGLIRRR